jgi:hypothetical protein
MREGELMASRGRCVWVLSVVYLLVGMSSLPLMGSSPTADGDEDRGPGPLDASEVWTDPLDDTSSVYQTTDVLVSGGEVRLAPGNDMGWIASETIPAKLGYRYDFVLLETDLPGNSRVQISILNASKESGEIGFANETISGFKKENGTYLSLLTIDPDWYPVLRIQVNLIADGVDRPTLHTWSLYYVPQDEWRDDFLGDWKMASHRGFNFTGDQLEVNVTSARGGDYEAYPALVTRAYTSMSILYSNANRTGYLDDDPITPVNALIADIDMGDLDGDGYVDMVTADGGGNSTIYWGSMSGTFSPSDKNVMGGLVSGGVAIGDYNGDGWYDMAFAIGTNCLIRLNQGSGTFNNGSDITFTGQPATWVNAGDVNGDDYDDVIFSGVDAEVYFGGPNGPDTTPDKIIEDIRVERVADVDGDGYADLLGKNRVLGQALNVWIYMGSSSGPVTPPDYTLDPLGDYVRGIATGDINGDGYTDIVSETAYSRDFLITIYEGDADGWTDSRRHEDIISKQGREMAVGDINKDGYDDIAWSDSAAPDYWVDVGFGGSSWPTGPNITKMVTAVYKIVFAIPKDLDPSDKTYRSSFTTERIDLPVANDKKWDMLILEGTTAPNTTSMITVMDGTGKLIPGYRNLDRWNVDLSDIDRLTYSSIKIRVNIISEFNHTTPILDKLTVKWIDKMTWRDQFYGDVRCERLIGVDVMDGSLQTDSAVWLSPQIIFSSLQNNSGFNRRSHAYVDAGGIDFLSQSPMEFPTRGTAAFDVADVNGDGFLDIAFAVRQTSDTNFAATSPLFLNSATGWRPYADHSFPTTGAADILLEDLNDDSYIDVVFAQEIEAQGDYTVNSTLFWGSADGWADTPDVEFTTTGAVDVEAFDHDGDDDLDLVFACYKELSTDIDSMVFTQGPDGFNGSSPSIYLATKAARGVAAADLNKDTYIDLVFANSFAGGRAEIDSWIYWGNNAGGFDTTTTGLPTVGAEDVELSDLNNDGHLDIVFANHIDNIPSRNVSSYIYLNDGSGGFASTPDFEIPSTGAVAVTVGDLDGTGWKDLVFACQQNDTSYNIPSVVYLGGSSGWASTPDIVLPTEGASDAMVVQLTRKGYGGYISRAITPDPLDDPGMYHTLRYEANLGGSRSGTIQLVDAVTEEVLAELPLGDGPNEWSLEGLWYFKEHSSIRVVVIGEGLDQPGSFGVDNLWLNWSKRVHGNPVVQGMELSATSVYRTKTIELWVNATDEFDLPEDLAVTVEYALNGTDIWETDLLSPSTYKDSTKRVQFTPRVDTIVGHYDFRVMVTDLTDQDESGYAYFRDMLVVMNNLPTAPGIILTPARATTTTPLQVDISQASWDVESSGLTYSYSWYLDGVLQESLTDNVVSSANTTKNQNWSVEVRAGDGEDEGLPAMAWRVIENAGPAVKQTLTEPMFDEDTVDSEWLDLTDAFWDPDGDPLTWTVNPVPQNLTVDIDPSTGQVTITPQANWNGYEEVTFIASDGELQAAQRVNVIVIPVNDIPRFATVNGEPVEDGPIEITIQQGGLLEIDVLVLDVEGDELLFDTNSTIIDLDGTTGSISWQPDNDEVGKLHFSLSERPDDGPCHHQPERRRQVRGGLADLPQSYQHRPRHPIRPGAQLHVVVQPSGCHRLRLCHRHQSHRRGHPHHHPHRVRRRVREACDGDHRGGGEGGHRSHKW